MTRVAIVGHRAARDAAADDLYPDADQAVLVASLAGRGIEAVPVAWDAEVSWGSFTAAVIRSTWDSVDRPVEYLRWARFAARETVLLNPSTAIEWNLDKRYLVALAELGVPVVPTLWVTAGSRWSAPAHEFVIKPSISAGGRETARYVPAEAGLADEHISRLLAVGHTVMVQPYLSSVETEGEAKLVFLGGVLSHTVRVGALLDPSAGVVERPWEKAVPLAVMMPSSRQVAVAHLVLGATRTLLGTDLLYARVDLVTGPGGDPCLAELELIDPALHLRREPQAADRLAAAIDASLPPAADHR